MQSNVTRENVKEQNESQTQILKGMIFSTHLKFKFFYDLQLFEYQEKKKKKKVFLLL